ncbi:MAG TPA: C4-dicarboxylate ABC transporter [Candidatus Binatia bacterium]|nr:C4-dicarboxylate ABC transporter [Candidatus Binatia bacterium]
MWEQLDRPSDAVRHLHPGWFASVMGTGILAVATHHAAVVVPELEGLAVGFWLLTTALCAILIVPWLARWAVYPKDAWADTGHPTRGPFYSTMPIGLLVLGVDFAAIGSSHMDAALAVGIAQGLWITGTLLAFLFGIVIPYRWFTSPSVPLEHVNGGWFIPPVANIVVPAAAAPLVSTWGSDDACRLACLTAFAFFGIGFLLFVVVGVLLVGRLIEHPLPAAHLAPTLWIGLGPVGVGSLALARLGTTATPVFGPAPDEAQVLLRLAAVAVWGFGLWWIAVAVALTIRYAREPFPFAMSWWAFTFPLGAYTVATFVLGDAYRAPVLTGFGFVLWAVLTAIWVIVALRTVAGTYSGALLKPPPPLHVAR